jgi:hypothetical protein
MRELVWELRELAAQGAVTVSIALHPFRITALDDIQHRLLEDYWSGIQLTSENLDSLDGHDIGVPTFHAAVGRSAASEFFFPLLGTWFDWDARNDNRCDPVKRLYVREVRTASNRRGEPLLAVQNRELHAERDTNARHFVHVDGKLRAIRARDLRSVGHEPSSRLRATQPLKEAVARGRSPHRRPVVQPGGSLLPR